MTDLIQVLPDLDTQSFAHILPSLEKAFISTNDLITLDAVDVAKRAQVPPNEVRRLADQIVHVLHVQLGVIDGEDKGNKSAVTEEWATVSTLDEDLDAALNGGFPVGQLSEVTGESAAGKTQLLLSLLLAVQLPRPYGLNKGALYISTEAPLQTKRLAQILDKHPLFASLPPSDRPTLSHIQSAQIIDLQSQDHIVRYQLPVQIQRSNIGLVVIDSIAANFRAEFESSKTRKTVETLAERSSQLAQLGALLRDIARTHNVAIVCANQVLDRFTPAAMAFDHASILSQRSVSTQMDNSASASGNSTPNGSVRPHLDTLVPTRQDNLPPSSTAAVLSTSDPLALDHQQRFFTGWGDDQFKTRDLKTPSLGLTWTNQLAGRIALLKEPVLKPQDYVLGPGLEIVGWNRWVKVAFAGWCKDHNGVEGVPFEIWEGGIRAKVGVEDRENVNRIGARMGKKTQQDNRHGSGSWNEKEIEQQMEKEKEGGKLTMS